MRISFTKLLELAQAYSSQDIPWHHHFLTPACQFGSAQVFQIILENEQTGERFECDFEERPMGELRQLENIFFKKKEISDVYRELRQLEESLWDNETRFNKKYMDQILAPDFVEFGRSGKIYKRKDTMAVSKDEALSEYLLEDFQVSQIGEEVFLVTYISRVMFEALEVANRSSVWQKSDKGWQILFHQGTPGFM